MLQRIFHITQLRKDLLPPFRAFLRREGYAVLREEAVCEDGKFYFAMKAVPGTADDRGMPRHA